MNSKYIFYIILSLIILIILIYFYQYFNGNKNDKKELFSEVTVDSEFKTLLGTVSDFIRENGFDSMNALKSFVQGYYNEDIDDILEQKTLTLYYSAFSRNSIPGIQSRIWQNISPYFKDVSDTNCKLLSYDNSHFEFSEAPYANKYVGIEMLSNRCFGPQSHLMGIQGNGTFTVFFVIKFNGFSVLNESQRVFQIYGNTQGNNALSLDIDADLDSKQGKMINIKPKLYYGDNDVILMNNNNDEEYFNIDMDKKYMVIITKKHRNISLNLHDLSKNAVQDATYPIIKDAHLDEMNVLFSNKQMCINPNENLNSNIFAFGIYNMHLLDESVLHYYMYDELRKSTEDFMREARQILRFQEEIDMLKACPYDESVCKECKIDDWTDMNKIMYASEPCKKAVDEFCKNNLNHPKCRCWRPENEVFPQCQAYINIFRNERLVNPNKIDKDILDEIAKMYNLCDCDEKEKLKEQVEQLEKDLEKEKNKLPPTHTLTSGHLPQNANMTTSELHGSDTLLNGVNNPNLSPINSQRFQDIANKDKTYDADLSDKKNSDKSLDPYAMDNTLIGDGIDPNYKNEINEPPKGFWAWLFGQ